MDTRDKAHKLCFAPFYSLCCRHKISDLIWLKLLWDDLLRLQDDLRFVCTFSVLHHYIYYISCNRSNMLILGTFRITMKILWTLIYSDRMFIEVEPNECHAYT